MYYPYQVYRIGTHGTLGTRTFHFIYNFKKGIKRLIKTKEKTVLQLPVNQLRPFEGNPYQVKDDAEMVQLIESIQIQGILTPLTVRPLDDGHYEVISGHRRLYACQQAGIETVPAFAVPMSREEAAAYFGIGINKLRDLTSNDNCPYVLWIGSKRLIKRRPFERYLETAFSV